MCFLSKRYSTSINYREDLITGYLKAIQALLQTSFGTGDSNAMKVKSINFERHRIQYNQKGRLLVVAISDGEDHESTERELLENISEDFYRRFQGQIERFVGDITAFKSYEARLVKYQKLYQGFRAGIPKVSLFHEEPLISPPFSEKAGDLNPI